MGCPEYQTLTEDLATARACQRQAMTNYAQAQLQNDPSGWQEGMTNAKSELDRAEQEVKTCTQALQEHRQSCDECRSKR